MRPTHSPRYVQRPRRQHVSAQVTPPFPRRRRDARGPAGFALLALVIISTMWPAGHTLSQPTNTASPPGDQASISTQEQQAPSAAEQRPSAQALDETLQGPALHAPQEIYKMLDQQRAVLDKKDQALQLQEAKLIKLREEISALLDRHDRVMKGSEQAERARAAARETQKAAQEKRLAALSEAKEARLRQVAKMYEAMPTEEAAARIEKMPTATALKVLQLIRSKTAGNILGQIPPEKAAKLTEIILKQQEKKD